MALRGPLKIVIPGGSGQVGTILARHFHEQGHDVTVLSRRAKPAPWRTSRWDGLEIAEWVKDIDGSDVVINLAGRSVNCRYNAANRRQILNSRTITTGLVGRAIAQAAHPPAVWLNASTSTIYRHSLDRPMDEATGELGGNGPGNSTAWDFSVEVALSWERACFAAQTPRTRRVAMRSAMIMSPDCGGAFDTLLRLGRYGLAGTVGPGNQFVSWIHDVDFVRAVEFLIEREEMEGPVNVCSPCPVPNRFFMRCLRHAWCTSHIGIPSPRWALEIGAFLLGTETELLLKSRRVVPKRLLDASFDFHFPNWRGASQDLVHRWRECRPGQSLSPAVS
jgi:uncharacterized protein (TIGR01777 family)